MNGNRFLDLLELRHHVIINLKTSGGIQKQNVVSVLLRMCKSCLCNVYRAFGIPHFKNRNANLFSVYLKLPDCTGTINVKRCQKGLLSLQLQLACKLGCGGCFTGALKTCHHDHRDRFARLECNLRGLRAHQADHLFIDDLDNLLCRVQSVHHLGSDCPLLNGCNELLHDAEVDVRLQKRHLHFLQRLLDILLRQLSLPAELGKCPIQFLR